MAKGVETAVQGLEEIERRKGIRQIKNRRMGMEVEPGDSSMLADSVVRH